MTEHERQTVRRLIDQAKRALVAKSKTDIDLTQPVRRCLYCGNTFNWQPERTSRKRFCTLTHKSNYWRREVRRRERERETA
jgi:hypothetical protein